MKKHFIKLLLSALMSIGMSTKAQLTKPNANLNEILNPNLIQVTKIYNT